MDPICLSLLTEPAKSPGVPFGDYLKISKKKNPRPLSWCNLQCGAELSERLGQLCRSQLFRMASVETRSSKHLHTFSHQHMYQSTWLSSAPDVNPCYLSDTNHTEHCRQRKEICWKLKYEAAFLECSKKHMNIKDNHYSKKSSFEKTL